MSLPKITDEQRFPSPTVTPQALAWDGKQFWISSRDLGTACKVDAKTMKVAEEIDSPGVIWAAAAKNGAIYCTIGKGTNDDRHVYRHDGNGFTRLFACPDFTGSYLSSDGKDLYLSQWYEQRILKLDEKGNIVGKIDIGAEICGHTFANGTIYVLRGTENVPRPQYATGPATPERFRSGTKPGEEQWWIARLDPRQQKPQIEDVAVVPFAARSLAFDGKKFWSNHRAANEIVSFSLPS